MARFDSVLVIFHWNQVPYKLHEKTTESLVRSFVCYMNDTTKDDFEAMVYLLLRVWLYALTMPHMKRRPDTAIVHVPV